MPPTRHRRRFLELGLATLLSATGMAAGQSVSSTPGSADEMPALLVAYDFEASEPSGPDTFRLFQRPAGSVDLSSSFRISGERSLRLSEGAADGDFSEFLGFFPERREGLVFVQFYLLLTDPDERFNFALAGPRWFLSEEQHGHAFWLATRDGQLWHRTGREWKPLFTPTPFTWYFVDLLYDVEAGSYDLALWEEGADRPLVDLHDQRNTADQSRSSVRFYSFIGDLEDEDRAMLYIDDLLIATDPSFKTTPFVAPGRRRFFVDLYAAGRPKLAAPERDDLLFEARSVLREGGGAPVTFEHALADRLERAADEAFELRDLDLAEELYVLLSSDVSRAGRVLLKLSDVHHLRGDVDSERAARERIYGRLELEEVEQRRERLERR